MADCYLVMRTLKGPSFNVSQVVCAVEDEATAKKKCAACDGTLRAVLSSDVVKLNGNGSATVVGKKVMDVLDLLGIGTVSHWYAEVEMEGAIHVPESRVVLS